MINYYYGSFLMKCSAEDEIIDKPKDFDFLIGGEFLRGTLEELVLRHEALKQKTEEDKDGESITKKIGVEEIIDVEYVERTPAPEPENCLMHDDWVSSVDATDSWLVCPHSTPQYIFVKYCIPRNYLK